MSNVNYDKLYSDWLEHHGVKGQKWGVQNGPPYPLGSDVSTGSALKKGARKKAASGAAGTIKKVYKKVKSAVQARREKRKEKRRAEMLKDPRKLVKNMDKFSNEELAAARKRMEDERQLRNLANDKIKAPANKIDAYLKYFETFNKFRKLKNTFKADRNTAEALRQAYEQLMDKRLGIKQEEKQKQENSKQKEKQKEKPKGIKERLADLRKKQEENRRKNNK